MSSNRLIPLAALEQLLKQAGCERVSEGAKRALKLVLEEKAMIIGKKAWELAVHAGRRTVKEEDVYLANK
ncbi:NFYB/HAP3 family transcription factor subunit [Candidatus Woesearchaeota archaeon]|nr:NFYB/HAP3 family transcription factor subunit [Candidatus Woesearchaeota archaeon]